MTGKVVRGSWIASALALAALFALLGPGEAAAAKKPELGLWQGTAGNAQLSFRVMRTEGRDKRAVTYVVYGCPAPDVPLDLTWWRDSNTGAQNPGDTTKVDAFAINRRGKFRDHTSFSPTIRGRLHKHSGRVRIDLGETFGGGGTFCGARKAKVKVRKVGEAVTPTSGVWRALGSVGTDFRFEVFGSSVDLWDGEALTGMGRLQGAPAPCITPLGFIGGASAPAWIDRAGGFTMNHAYVEPDTITGRFESRVSLTGNYDIATPPLISAQLNCIDFAQPFVATLEEPTPTPTLQGRRLTGKEAGPEGPPPPPPPLPTPTRPTQYVALGDSYSSGEGVPPFFEENKRCHRSQRAYAQLFNPPGYTMQTTLLACSGAQTINVGRLMDQGWTAIPQKGEPTSQLERLIEEVWRPVDLVTITIGGNDAKFANVVGRCIFTRLCHRGKAARKVKKRIAETLPGLLYDTYRAIRSKVPIRNGPNTTVVVLGYPQLFPDKIKRRCVIQGHVISKKAQRFMRERGEQLNEVIQYVASLHNFHYVSVEKTFADHEICGKDRSWLHGLKVPKLKYSFHPNERGQRAYHDALTLYFSCLYQRGFGFRPSGVPFNPGNGLTVPDACKPPEF